jgi:hypothetical protein
MGASNPYIVLARIVVGTGVTQITNSDITDLRFMMALARTTFTGARVKRATSQTGILASTLTTVGWDGEDFDSSNFHDNTTNNSRLIIPTTGKYLLGMHIEWDAWDSTATPYRLIIDLYKNGALYVELLDTHVSNNGGETAWTVTELLAATAGDYFEWRVFQGTPNTRALTTNSYSWINYEGS